MANNGAKNGRKRKFPLLFLGIDGGGTKTHAVIMNAAKEIVSEGEAGPSNPLRVGVETAVSNIIKATEDACDRDGLIATDISAATLGLAGVRRRDIRERVKESFCKRLNIKNTTVVTDAEIALFGTTLGKPGLVVIAGTGSICLGKNGKGETAISGGWGPLAGDEGGGAGIAQTALHTVAKASDGRGRRTALTEKAAEYFRASGPENLIVAIYSPQVDNLRIAGFARLVVETALDGDQVAIDILNDAGRELGIAACAVIKKLKLEHRKIPIGCVGSVFLAGDLLKRPMLQVIHKTAPDAFLTEPVLRPSHAAAIMAFDTIRSPVPAE
jgi:N-acetylglucosamine kinase-like BadF-type ATPase